MRYHKKSSRYDKLEERFREAVKKMTKKARHDKNGIAYMTPSQEKDRIWDEIFSEELAQDLKSIGLGKLSNKDYNKVKDNDRVS